MKKNISLKLKANISYIISTSAETITNLYSISPILINQYYSSSEVSALSEEVSALSEPIIKNYNNKINGFEEITVSNQATSILPILGNVVIIDDYCPNLQNDL